MPLTEEFRERVEREAYALLPDLRAAAATGTPAAVLASAWALVRCEQPIGVKEWVTSWLKARDPLVKGWATLITALAEHQLQPAKTVLKRYQAAQRAFDAAGAPQLGLMAAIFALSLENYLTSDPASILQQADELLAEPDLLPLDRGRLLRTKAALLANHGKDYLHALTLLEEAQGYFSPEATPIEWVKTIFEQAYAKKYLERLDEAFSALDGLLPLFERVSLPLQKAFYAKLLGSVLLMLGRYDEGVAAIKFAEQGFRTFPREDQDLDCKLLLGNAALYFNLYDAAINHYEEVLNTKHHQRLKRFAQRNKVLALILKAPKANDPRAEIGRAKTLRRSIKTDNALELCEIKLLDAEIALFEHDYELAIVLFTEAAHAFEHLANYAAAAESRLKALLTRLDYCAGSTLDPDDFIALAEALKDQPKHLWRVYYGAARAALSANQPQAALKAHTKALEIVAQMRSTFNLRASSQVFDGAGDLYCEAIQTAKTLQDLSALLRLSELHRATALRYTLLQRDYAGPAPLGRLVRDIFPRPSKPPRPSYPTSARSSGTLLPPLPQPTPINFDLSTIKASLAQQDRVPSIDDLALVRQQLSARYTDWVALVYVHVEGPGRKHQIMMLTIDQHMMDIHQIPFSSDDTQLLARVEQQRYMLPHNATRFATHAELANLLLPPKLKQRLERDPSWDPRLLIVPTGWLHKVPWPLLRLDRDGQAAWLCERATIQTMPCLLCWPNLAERSADGDVFVASSATFADPGLTPLAHAQAEHDRLAAFYRPQAPLVELHTPTMTSAALRAALAANQTYRLIHLITHAEGFDAQSGIEPHLITYDGVIGVSEILDWQLGGADIVLSLCWGGRGDPAWSDEHLSLAQAFLLAGAGSVISNIWGINDEYAQFFMHDLHKLLKDHDPARALTLAQRKHCGDLARASLWGGMHATGRC